MKNICKNKISDLKISGRFDLNLVSLVMRNNIIVLRVFRN